MAQALSLDLELSSSQYASITDASQSGLDITGDITIELWVKLESASTIQTFCSKNLETGDQRSYFFRYRGDLGTPTLDFVSSDDGTSAGTEVLSVAYTIPLNTWIHLAVRFDASASTARFYVNGTQQGADQTGTNTSIYSGSAAFRVGVQESSTGTIINYMDGKIKDLRIWNDLRTDAEVLNNRNVVLTGLEANLVSNWLFDGDYTDQAGNNDLTASNSPVFSPDIPMYPGDFGRTAKITIDNTQVSGSSDLTDFPALFADANFIADVYTNAKTFTDQCLDLESSSSQYGSITDASQTGLDLTAGTFTVEGWIKLETLSTILGYSQTILAKDNEGAGTGYTLRISVVDNKLDWVNSAGTSYKSTTALTTGRWYNFAIVYNGTNIQVYLDGVKELDTAYTAHSGNANNFNIGRNNTHGHYFDGKIKDIRIWSEARTYKNLVSYMNTELAGTETNLQGYWKFDNSALDETSNNNDLTLSGSPTYATDAPRGGADLRFTTDRDGANEISCEVVKFDNTNSAGEVWVKIPTLSYNTDTDIYVWYNNAGATFRPTNDAKGSQAVWSAYSAVYHTQEEGGTRKDSGANAYDLTDVNTVLSGTGKVARGADFELSNSEYLYKATTDTALNPSGATLFTVEGWFNLESLPASLSAIIVNKKTDNSVGDCFKVYVSSDGSINCQTWASSGSFLTIDSTINASIATWYHVAFVKAATNDWRVYVNGSLVASSSSTRSNASTNLNGISIGAEDAGSSGVNNYFDGLIDEVRVLTAVRTTDWIATEYANQNAPGTFATGGTTGTDYTQGIDETVTVVDTASKETGKVLNETVVLVDTIARSLDRTLSEVITLVDTIDTAQVFTETLNEILTLADTGEQKVTAKTLFEALALVDTASRDLDRTLDETLILVETTSVAKTYLREFSETITLAETLAKQANKNLSELITLVDDASASGQYARSLDETATLVDDVVNTAGKVLTDTLALVDTIAKVGVFARELDESISLVERFQGLLNGQNIAWFRKYTEQAGTFIKKYLDIP